MDCGFFYFLKNEYADTYGNYGVMPNKETDDSGKHSRPYFYSVRDTDDSRIMWMIPISSKVSKYQKLCEEKKQKYHIKQYDGIVFGNIRGYRRAFLIQNMCPVIDKYIDSQYLYAETNEPITISSNTHDKIVNRAMKLISLSKKGKRCTMTDIPSILDDLQKELSNQNP